MRYEKKVTIKTKVCDRCGDEFEYDVDDVLEEHDCLERFPDMYIKSIHCPYCNERNILEIHNTKELISGDRS